MRPDSLAAILPCADGCGRQIRYIVQPDRAAEKFPILNHANGLCHDCAMRAEIP